MVPRRHFIGAIGYPVASFALVGSMVLDPRRMARARGLLVIADGAHALAHFDFAGGPGLRLLRQQSAQVAVRPARDGDAVRSSRQDR